MEGTMKVYVAAPWIHKEIAKNVQEFLISAGHVVTSKWVDTPDHDQNACDTMQAEAIMDREDVRKAEVLVLLNLAKSEGKATEFGMALAWEKPCIIVGKQEGNVFYHLPGVQMAKDLDEVLALLQ
jgi:nucleoside 2-deoxyribosyltransferase